MARVSEKLIQALFKEYCELLGKRVATKFDDVGALQLEYNSVYGGYQIQEIHNKGGAVDTPYGYNRYKPAEFEQLLRFGIKTLEMKKRK